MLDSSQPDTDANHAPPREPWVLRRGWRLYATLFLLIAVPAGVLVAFILVPMRAELLAQSQARNESLSRMLAVAVDEEVHGLRGSVEGTAARQELTEAVEAGETQTVRTILQTLVEHNPRLTRAFITDKAGVELYDYPHDASVIGKSFAHRDWFIGVSESNDTYISEMYKRAALGQPLVVSIATPILDDQSGSVAAYLVGQYAVEDLRAWMEHLSPTESLCFGIIDHHGQMALSDETAEIPDAVVEQLRVAAGRESFVTEGADSENYIFSASSVPSADWTAVAYVPSYTVTGPISSLLRTILLLFIICTAAMGLLGLIVVRAMRTYNTALRRADADLREAKAAADEASQAKSEFLAVMSHELRTPLNGVIGMTELLRDTQLDERQRRFLVACHESATSLLAIVNDILDFSKIEAGRLELAHDPFALHHCIDDSVSLLAHRAHARGLEINYYVDPKIRQTVLGDDARLRQVIVNLLSNAIKFTAEGQIVLRAVLERQDGKDLAIRCSVTDTGIGIPGDRRKRLFRSFSQLDRSTTRRYGGTGLGLAICRSLVEAMGGEIGVESREGEGSTFWFTATLERADVASRDPLIAPSDLKSLRILVVSDTEVAQDILAQTIASWEIEATVLAPSNDLVRILEEHDAQSPFDLIIFDLPVCQGAASDLAKAILHRSSPLRVPVFVLAPTNTESCDYEGAMIVHRSLRKPPSASELLNALIDQFCGRAESIERNPGTKPHGIRRNGFSACGRVLIAEDNLTSQMYASEVLEHAGFTCDVAGNGSEAISLLRAQQYDVVLMDCHMPEMDGFEATKQIRAMESQGVLSGRHRIIALTANAIKGDRERCLAAGMDDYISKPFEPNRLIEVVSNWSVGCAQPSDDPKTDSGRLNDASRTQDDKPPVDVEAALDRCLGKVDLLQATLDVFERETPQYLKQIDERLAVRDHEAVRMAAHAVKGAAGVVAAERLARIAGDLEAAAQAASLDAADTQMAALRREFDSCIRFVEDYMAGSFAGPAGVPKGEATDASPDR